MVISEKATVAGVLRPVMDEYGVPFFAAHGFNSKTKMHDFAEEILNDERRTVFLYVGDYDPSGMFMSEVDMMKRLQKYGCEYDTYTLKRIALTYGQSLALPSFEAEEKKTDPRYGWYVRNYGERCWEVDAMDPNDLRALVESEISSFISQEDWKRHKQIEAEEQETTRRLAQAIGAKRF